MLQQKHYYAQKEKINLFLITDSLEAAGLENGKYLLGNQDVYVKDGEARLIDGTLAGSIVSMNTAVKNAYEHSRIGL